MVLDEEKERAIKQRLLEGLKHNESIEEDIYFLVGVTDVNIGDKLNELRDRLKGNQEVQELSGIEHSKYNVTYINYSKYSYEYDAIEIRDVSGFIIVDKSYDLDIITEVTIWN